MRLLVPVDRNALARNNFDALRLAMALLVVWSHSFALWFGSEAKEPFSLLLGGVYNAGNIGVLAFFTISGFLITLSYMRASSWRSYLGRRVGRIHPGYIVATLVCSLVIVPAFSSRAFGDLASWEWRGLASNLLLQNYIIPSDAFWGGPVNGALWSIPFEFWCYLGVLGLGLTGLIRRRWVFPLVTAVLMLTRVWLDLTDRHPGGLLQPIIGPAHLWFAVLPPFMLGATVLAYRDRLPRSRALLLGLIAAAIVSAHLPIADPMRATATRFLFPLTLAYGIFYVAFSSRLRLHDAARFGDFSYGTYLYAFPVQQMLVATIPAATGFPAYVAASLALSLAAGVASWFLVERWFIRRARRRAERKALGSEATLVAP